MDRIGALKTFIKDRTTKIPNAGPEDESEIINTTLFELQDAIKKTLADDNNV